MIYHWNEESLSFNLMGNIHAKKVELYSKDGNILIVPYGTILEGVNRLGLQHGSWWNLTSLV